MLKLKMAETTKDAVMYIEQGHVKVGVDTVTDPCFHVNRHMEDHVTWVKTSSINKMVMDYREERDDFTLFEWERECHNLDLIKMKIKVKEDLFMINN